MLGCEKIPIECSSSIAKNVISRSSINSSSMILLPTAMPKLLLLHERTNQTHRVIKMHTSA